MDLGDFRDLVWNEVRDEAKYLKPAGDTDWTLIDQAIQSAVETYSKDRPYRVSKEYTGDGTTDYDLPADWVQAFSTIVQVEYPVGDDPPTYLNLEDVIFYRDPTTGLHIKFVGWTPSASETWNLFYSKPHTVDGSSSTVYINDASAVAFLAASYCFRLLAARFAQHTSTTIAADAVAYRDKTAQYTPLADKLEERYLQKMGKSKSELKIRKFASETKDFDTGFISGHPHLTHPTHKR